MVRQLGNLLIAERVVSSPGFSSNYAFAASFR